MAYPNETVMIARSMDMRFVLLKNPWNLTPTQKQSLTALVRTNGPLSRAWYLKEDFQRFWDNDRNGSIGSTRRSR